MTRRTTRALISLSALLYGLLGVALIFAPDEIGAQLKPGLSSPLIFSLWGSALFGFALMNWTARGSRLGGIYGRPIVAGNQGHALVGALALARAAFAGTPSSLLFVILGVYWLQVAFFTYLMFFSDGLGD